MGSVDLSEIKKSKVEDLQEDDVKTLQENWDDLEDDEKDFYKQYAPEKDDEKMKAKIEGQDDEEDEEEGGGGDEKDKSIPPTLTESKIKNIFKEQLENYLKKRDPKKPVTKQEKEWFGKDWSPKSYDEFAEQFYVKAIDRMQKEAQQRRDDQEERIKKENEKITDELNKIEGIPDEGTTERVEFERDFTKWAIEYGVAGSVPKAYELYMKTKNEKSKVPDKQKQTQSKINRSGGGTSNQQVDRNYSKDVRDRSMDDIVASAVDKWGDLDK